MEELITSVLEFEATLPALALVAVLCGAWYWSRGRHNQRPPMSRQEWKAHKAKQSLESQRQAQEQTARRKAARAARQKGYVVAGQRLALPDHQKTNATEPYIAPYVAKEGQGAAPARQQGSSPGTRPATKSLPVVSAEAERAYNVHAADLPTMPEGYRDFKLIGNGGFGDVMFARRHDGTPVAIKTLRLTSSNREMRERWFRREVRLLSELMSPAIPRLLEHRLDIAQPYFVMEYIDGHNLGEHISSNGPLQKLQLVQNLAIYTASALTEMHGKGFIHRDIKPANIMVTSRGRFKLIDLGIGKDTGSDSTPSNITAGTLAFAAPESVINGNSSTLADIFSWGATIGYAMTGLMPYGPSLGPSLMIRVMNGEIDPAFLSAVQKAGKRFGTDNGRVLAKVVATSVQPDPSRRNGEFLRVLARH